MTHHKKIILLLIPLIIGAGILLVAQIKRALSITTTPSNTPLISPESIFIPISSDEPILSNPGAPLTIIEFADLGCTKCGAIHSTLSTFVAAHPEEVRLIFKSAPEHKLFLKANTLAHQAAWCAAKQQQYWPFITAAFATKKTYLDENIVKKIGNDLKLNFAPWWTCTTGNEAIQKIAESVTTAFQVGAAEQPTIFLNNRRLYLADDLDIEQLLNSLIAP